MKTQLQVIKGLLLAMGFIFLYSCNSHKTPQVEDIQLSAADQAVADSLHFDKLILQLVRQQTDSAFRTLTTELFTRDSDYLIPNNGLLFNAKESEVEHIVNLLSAGMQKNGYFIFSYEHNFGFDPDVIAVIKSKDQFDIVRHAATDGVNYDIYNDSVVTLLQNWNKKYPLRIKGAGRDWLAADFIERPQDMDAFAKEVYAVCPDVVDQGTGTVEELAKEMKQSNELYLWWD